MESYKIVVVGDDNAGRVEMLQTYKERKYPEYIPIVFENQTTKHTVNNKTVTLDIWDVAGFSGYEALRTSFYINTSLVVLCFDIGSAQSFKSLFDKWVPEILLSNRSMPFILVGTHGEKRLNKMDKLVDINLIKDYAKRINAVSYIECSAEANQNISTIFDTALNYLTKPHAQRQIITTITEEDEEEKKHTERCTICIKENEHANFFILITVLYICYAAGMIFWHFTK